MMMVTTVKILVIELFFNVDEHRIKKNYAAVFGRLCTRVGRARRGRVRKSALFKIWLILLKNEKIWKHAFQKTTFNVQVCWRRTARREAGFDPLQLCHKTGMLVLLVIMLLLLLLLLLFSVMQFREYATLLGLTLALAICSLANLKHHLRTHYLLNFLLILPPTYKGNKEKWAHTKYRGKKIYFHFLKTYALFLW